MTGKTTTAAMGLALLATTGLARADGELNIYNWGQLHQPAVSRNSKPNTTSR